MVDTKIQTKFQDFVRRAPGVRLPPSLRGACGALPPDALENGIAHPDAQFVLEFTSAKPISHRPLHARRHTIAPMPVKRTWTATAMRVHQQAAHWQEAQLQVARATV